MINKRDIIQVLCISIILVITGIYLINTSNKLLECAQDCNTENTIDKILLSADGKSNSKTIDLLTRIKKSVVLNKGISVDLLSASHSLGWFLICIGGYQLTIAYTLYASRKKQLAEDKNDN